MFESIFETTLSWSNYSFCFLTPQTSSIYSPHLTGVEPKWPHTLHHLRIHSPPRLPATRSSSSCLHRVRHLSWRGVCRSEWSTGPQWQHLWPGGSWGPGGDRRYRWAEGQRDQRGVWGDSSHRLWRWSSYPKVYRWRLCDKFSINYYTNTYNTAEHNAFTCTFLEKDFLYLYTSWKCSSGHIKQYKN